jgi:4-hydroxy-3-methylbut-2-enyl diphosphate reductase
MDPLQVGDMPAFDPAPPLRPVPVVRPDTALCTLLAPMRMEAAALRRGLPDSISELVRTRVTGIGPRRSRRAAVSPEVLASRSIAVVGIGTALSDRLRPGDVVVIDELRTDALTEGPVPATRRLASAPLVAAALRRQGLTVHVGASISTDRLNDSARERLARTGVLIADCESAWLLGGRRDHPAACVRVVAGGSGLVNLGRALRALPKVAAGLAEWATTTVT